MPKGKKLTVKQRRFVKEYVKEGNGTQAALAAYNTVKPEVATVIANENLGKPNVREAVEEALVKLDLTPEYILKKHKDIADHSVKTDDDGKITEIKDGMVAERALENIGKIAGLYPSSQTNLELSDGKLSILWEN